MIVAFDAQLLFEEQKTGIGWNAKMMIDQIIQDNCNEYQLNCFTIRKNTARNAMIEEYRAKGCRIKECRWLPASIYYHLDRLLPFPYHWIFGKKADITQFFNYTLPFGVHGKRVTIVHDMAFKAYPETVAHKTRRWLDKHLAAYCRRADVIITVSEFSKREIMKYLPVNADKIKVVYNGVDLERYRPDYTLAQISEAKEHYGIKGNYILYLGTLEPRKNIEGLIEAYRLLKLELPAAPHLVLAGKKGWMYDSIFDLVNKYHLQNEVVFTGYVEEQDAPCLMCGAQMFVFPSLYEGFGIPPLEAMACKTPVIVSNTSSLPEVVGDAGLKVPSSDYEALKNCMKELLTNPVLKERLREHGAARAREFTWSLSAKKLMMIYHEMNS